MVKNKSREIRRIKKPESVENRTKALKILWIVRIFGCLVFLTTLTGVIWNKVFREVHEHGSNVIVGENFDMTEEEFFYNNGYLEAHELWEMLQGSDDKIDLARGNFIIAQSICHLTEEHYRKIVRLLDEAILIVLEDAEKALQQILEPEEKWRSDAQFLALCGVIQRRAPQYNPAYQTSSLSIEQQKSMLSDPANMFLHGLLLERKGTCANMPLFYLAAGQRLGWPVYGVTIGRHLFIRWDSPAYRVNFEPTITSTIAMTADDAVYTDIEGVSPAMLVNSSWLHSLTRREMIGQFFNSRAGCYLAAGKLENAWADFNRARALCPKDPGIAIIFKTCTATRREKHIRMLLNASNDPFSRDALMPLLEASQLGGNPMLPVDSPQNQ